MKPRVPLLLLLICIAFFAGTLFLLLKWRFENGDVYPRYSSLRSDPLGTMIFFESLERLPGLTVRRDLSAAGRLPRGENTTYLHLAGDAESWKEMPEKTAREIERFLLEGGRLVILLSPQTDDGRQRKDKADEKDKSGEEEEDSESVALLKKWNLELAFEPLKKKGSNIEPVMVRNVSSQPLPPELRWHSGAILKNLGPAWTAIYSREKNPVLAEREFGAGSLVFATDAYVTSNEAMLRNRHAGLLAWLIGPNRQIVFDEAHLGVMSEPGIAALARKYRLYGFVGAVLILAALFIWKNSSSLVPPPPSRHRDMQVIGRDSAAGFASLLRRNIPPDKLLEVCAGEWRRTFAHDKRSAPGKAEKIAAILAGENARPARKRNPVEAYRRICRALKAGRTTGLASDASD